MPRRFLCALLAFGALTFTAGCAVNRATATVTPGAAMESLKTFYVVRLPADNRGVENLIRDDLIKRGYAATSGPELAHDAYTADAVVTYEDRWMWDITMYMIELDVTLRNSSNGFPIASGKSFHTSLTRKSPPEMVTEVMTNIFDKMKLNAKGGSK